MIKTIKRWARNIMWLLNSPPVPLKLEEDRATCDYCGEVRFCWGCIRKALDRALKKGGE